MSVFRAFITLGRLQLLPTVWSNCLAGWWLGGGGNERKLPFLLAGATCLYLGGAFLNDAFDALFDRQHRRTRPIPAGAVTAGTVWVYGLIWLASGVAVLFSIGIFTGSIGLVLAFWVVFFNAIHRTLTFWPLVLGVSRLLVYLVAASIGSDRITGLAIWCGIAQAVYVGGAGFPLRRENAADPVRYWPLLLLGAPIVLATVMNTSEYRERLAVISAKSVNRRHVADETPQRWPLSISSFTQVLDIVDGARWARAEPSRLRAVGRARRRRTGSRG